MKPNYLTNQIHDKCENEKKKKGRRKKIWKKWLGESLSQSRYNYEKLDDANR